MFCSTIIPTIGRSTLSRAVLSVLDQAFEHADFEVIVVNDSGRPLPAEDWQRSARVRLLDTSRRERSVARNAGAAIAGGKYLHFLDDDDVLLPGALEAFFRFDSVAADTATAWILGGWQTIGNDGGLLNEFRPPLSGNIFSLLVSGEGLPLQASMLRATHFFEVGGFDATPDLLGVEDRDLGRRVAMAGVIGHTNTLVAQIRVGQESSTTDWARIAERDRWGREKALNAPGAFRRLRASAASAYWRGRVSRAYLASTVWNLRRLNFSTAASRAVAGLAMAGASPLSTGYWQGLRTRVK